jgi:hypothetical protein
MDWIEHLLHNSPDGGSGSLELMYFVAPLAALLIGASPFFLIWFERAKKKKRKEAMRLSPDELGITPLEVIYLHAEGAPSGQPFVFEADLMNRLKSAAAKRKTTPEQLLSKAVIRAFENPAILSEIENHHVRRR